MNKCQLKIFCGIFALGCFLAGYTIGKNMHQDDWTKGFNECEAIYEVK